MTVTAVITVSAPREAAAGLLTDAEGGRSRRESRAGVLTGPAGDVGLFPAATPDRLTERRPRFDIRMTPPAIRASVSLPSNTAPTSSSRLARCDLPSDFESGSPRSLLEQLSKTRAVADR
jgi:hypothetical protein